MRSANDTFRHTERVRSVIGFVREGLMHCCSDNEVQGEFGASRMKSGSHGQQPKMIDCNVVLRQLCMGHESELSLANLSVPRPVSTNAKIEKSG